MRMKGTSTQQDDYVRHPLPTWDGRLLVGKHMERPVYKPNPYRMESGTTMKESFPGWPVQRRPHTAPPQPQTASPRVPFEGKSVSHEDYPKHPLPDPRHRQVAPRPTRSPAPAKFEGISTAHAHYPAHEIKPPERPTEAPPQAPRACKFEGQSRTHEDFQPHPVSSPRKVLPPRQEYVPNPRKFEGRSTASDAYRAWPIERQSAAVASPRSSASRGCRFEGQSRTHEDFQPHPVSSPRTVLPPRQEYVPNPRKFEGRSTQLDAYQRIELPVGVAALGVEVELGTSGSTPIGKFYPLIAAGTPPPAQGSAVFTTTLDNQSEVVIKALCMVDGKTVCLGSFEMTGIAPQPMGNAQIECTFDLDQSRVLYVSAVDRADRLRRSLTIRPGGGSPLLPTRARAPKGAQEPQPSVEIS
jgi:hypothetical protein